jgi:hypothetical protein
MAGGAAKIGWVVIFQLNASSKTRGGNAPEFGLTNQISVLAAKINQLIFSERRGESSFLIQAHKSVVPDREKKRL